MPTIHREGGFRFSFYSDERQEPPHVHVGRAEGKAKLWLNPVALASSRGFNQRELAAILLLVRANASEFLRQWNGYFRAHAPDPTRSG
jgi:Domain of unknown function (DUF4160)